MKEFIEGFTLVFNPSIVGQLLGIFACVFVLMAVIVLITVVLFLLAGAYDR
jgi:hypothetical protein